MPQSRTITVLFSDLVDSTDHLQDAAEEAGQSFFQAHHKLLTEAVTGSGGRELEWLGDGILAAFDSSADAVRCAIKIQQTARRPVGKSLSEIRIGLHCGELLHREERYFGTPLVVARRLCDSAEAGQILCSSMIAELLKSNEAFKFRDLGALQLKGIREPITAYEAVYERSNPIALLNRTPFVGREPQMKRLLAKLNLVSNGSGAAVTVVGEPGIGKSRTLEEFSDRAREHEAVVLRGACYDGEFQPPYGPFAEAILDYARVASPADLKTALRGTASTIAQIAPALRRHLGDIPEPPALDKEEARFRLLDAVAQFFIGLSQVSPLVLILDDLHWADKGTVAMLQHIAHFVPSNPILLIGAYRDAEVGRRHPMAAVLAGIRRLPDFERIALEGLGGSEVGELLGMVGDHDAPEALVQAISAETTGNPFFIRELLFHLVEEGKILDADGQWISKINIESLDIPDGVREIVERRVQRLSDDARRLLSVGAAFKGEFSFEVAAAVASLGEDEALDAVDEGLQAQLLRPGTNTEKFDFTHALIRHTLYSDLNPPRRVRMHREIAETMERHWGERVGEHAAEVAYHFWRSAAAEDREHRGVDYSLSAADRAEAACAYDEVVAFLRIALELMAPDDSRRRALLSRLGLALAWTLDGEGACRTAQEAGDLLAAAEGNDAAAVYLETVVQELYAAGLTHDSWKLAREGLRMAGERRDLVWARLREIDLTREEAEDPDNPGIRVDSPGEREWRAFLRTVPREVFKAHGADTRYESRSEIITDEHPNPASLMLMAGDYKRALLLWQKDANDSENHGRIGWAVTALGNVASCHIALGEFAAARAAMARGAALTARVNVSPSGQQVNLNLMSAQHDLRLATDEGWEELLKEQGSLDVLNKPKPENNWAFAMIRACGAYFFARINQRAMALEWINSLHDAFERGAAWEPTYNAVLCDAAATLWMLNCEESAAIIERCILTKILAPDFRYPMRDGRLSMARLCALQCRYDEAGDWFAKAREVLDEQGARPLRALADFDEATMYIRRESAGNGEKAKGLLESARDQFRSIAMNGWLIRAEEALSQIMTPRADSGDRLEHGPN